MSTSLYGRWAFALLIAVLYLMSLGGTGFVAADEPRYASIGRAMAETGDFITPRLDGSPWFEKPPLLYWTTAIATRFGFHDEWAARLPVALMSLAFLWFFYDVLKREFSRETAWIAVAILSTSVSWLAYSFAATPDLPMSVTLGAALLISLFDTRPGRGWVAGSFLGLAILAKGFVPLALFFPAWIAARGKRISILMAAFVVAAPWYILCWKENGAVFWNEFFWKHHVQRFFETSLEHVQPFWFYIPVALGLLFPWTPIVVLLFRRRTWDDAPVRFLGWWFLFGFVIFSISRNKLPGYLLPLMPALAIVLAAGLRKAPGREWLMGASALLLMLLPPAAAVLPEGLLVGIRRASGAWTGGIAWSIPFLAVAAAASWLTRKGNLTAAVTLCACAAAVGAGAVKWRVFPMLDERVSVRSFWRQHGSDVQNACLEPGLRRDWEYGLNYYARHPFSTCANGAVGPRIAAVDGRLRLMK